MTESEQRAWCAGFIDGEGSLSIYKSSSGRVYPQLRVASADVAAVERLRQFLGTGTIRVYTPPAPRVPTWRWYCNRRDLWRTLKHLQPYLVVKAREAEVLLELLSSSRYARDHSELATEIRRGKTKPGNRRSLQTVAIGMTSGA